MNKEVTVTKLLVIDDERSILEMLELSLSREGYEVLTAENGEKGVKTFQEKGPKLVLTDVKMPGIDGIEVLRRIKAIDADAEVIGDVRVGPPAHSKGPVDASALSEQRHPAIWTLEVGKGRVFGTTIGHNTFTYFDPRFRIMLFRAMAWAMRTPPDPFMPLVFTGITDDTGMVGTTDAMRDPAIKAQAKAAARGEKPEDLREREPTP